MSPLLSNTIPVPAALPFTMKGPFRVVITAVIDTTPGSTLAKIAAISTGVCGSDRLEGLNVVGTAAAIRCCRRLDVIVHSLPTNPPIPPNTKASAARPTVASIHRDRFPSASLWRGGVSARRRGNLVARVHATKSARESTGIGRGDGPGITARNPGVRTLNTPDLESERRSERAPGNLERRGGESPLINVVSADDNCRSESHARLQNGPIALYGGCADELSDRRKRLEGGGATWCGD